MSIDSREKKAQNLKLGGEYLVVAIASGPGAFWLFLDDRYRGLKYPLVYPAPFFEVLQSSFSRFWESGVWIDCEGGNHSLLAPQVWIQDQLFHGKLFDGDPEVLKTYEKMCTDLNVEYPLPWIDSRATALGEGNWVTSEDYDHQWEADPRFAMTQNPKTKELLHNPIFLPNEIPPTSVEVVRPPEKK